MAPALSKSLTIPDPDVGDGDGAGEAESNGAADADASGDPDGAADAEGLGVGPGTVAVARLTGVIATATANTIAPDERGDAAGEIRRPRREDPGEECPCDRRRQHEQLEHEVGDAVGAEWLRQQEERPGADRRERGNPDGARVGQSGQKGGQVGDVRAEVERPCGGAERGHEAGPRAGRKRRLASTGSTRASGWMRSRPRWFPQLSSGPPSCASDCVARYRRRASARSVLLARATMPPVAAPCP